MININIDDIIEYNKNGLSFDEISKKINVSVPIIMKFLKSNNIKLKNNISLIRKPIDKYELEKMYKKLIPINDIAKYFNCSVTTVRININYFNIELNTNKIYFLPFRGEKFNRLTFIEEYVKKNKKKIWLCECECGNIKTYDYYNIITGSVKSCGCYHKDHVKEYNWTGLGIIPGSYWKSLKKGAINRNIEFNITLEYILKLFNEQNGLCKLSNLKITFKSRIKKNDFFDASLDRIDSNKGYIEGNVQWIVKEINYMKNKINENKFIDLCKKINNYNNE